MSWSLALAVVTARPSRWELLGQTIGIRVCAFILFPLICSSVLQGCHHRHIGKIILIKNKLECYKLGPVANFQMRGNTKWAVGEGFHETVHCNSRRLDYGKLQKSYGKLQKHSKCCWIPVFPIYLDYMKKQETDAVETERWLRSSRPCILGAYFLILSTGNTGSHQKKKKKVRKRFLGGTFPSLDGKSACQFMWAKPGIMVIHLFIHCHLAVIIYTLHHISKSTPEYYMIIIKP